MPHSWREALLSYRYPVDLRKYVHAQDHPGWFEINLVTGDRAETIEFENHFRTHAANNIGPWLEVVFWKLFNHSLVRNGTTQRFGETNTQPAVLWGAVEDYVQNPSRNSFEELRARLGVRSRAIAVAATFPAFRYPEMHPMVDTRIAKWVGTYMEEHNAADADGPQLTRFPFLDNSSNVLTMSDFDSMQDWRKWCVHTANKLSERTHTPWRARDVEMAVFYTWGVHPQFRLNTLPVD